MMSKEEPFPRPSVMNVTWPLNPSQAQQETQKAALRYERAVSMHTASREMVYVAEQGLLADRNTLDPTWQEMLNHATAKVQRHSDMLMLSYSHSDMLMLWYSTTSLRHVNTKVLTSLRHANAKVQSLRHANAKVQHQPDMLMLRYSVTQTCKC